MDLTDAVAEALGRPFAEISMEMVDRNLYFVVDALQQDPTLDPCAIWPRKPRIWGSSNVPASRLNKRLRPQWPLLDMAVNSLTCA